MDVQAKDLGASEPPASANPGAILLMHSPSAVQADFDAAVERTVEAITATAPGGVVLGGGGPVYRFIPFCSRLHSFYCYRAALPAGRE
jgi:hypothetical protein